VDAVAAKRDTRRGEESRTKKKRCRRSGKQNRTNLHRDRIVVAYPSPSHARTKRKKKEENEPVSAPDREPDFSTDELAVLGEQTGKTRSHHGLRERLLHDPATLLAAARLFLQRLGQYSESCFLLPKEGGLEVCLNNIFATRGKLTSRKRESPVCDRKYTIPCNRQTQHLPLYDLARPRRRLTGTPQRIDNSSRAH